MYLNKIIKKDKFSYKNIIIFAIFCGIITGIILDIEMNKYKFIANNSFYNIGICFEFWIFMDMIIISRTKKPLEAAIKVFYFS